jgi:hypothetical protein
MSLLVKQRWTKAKRVEKSLRSHRLGPEILLDGVAEPALNPKALIP